MTKGDQTARMKVIINVDTSKDETAGPCNYIITPFTKETALKYDYKTAEEINLTKFFKDNFEVGSSNPDTCKYDSIDFYSKGEDWETFPLSKFTSSWKEPAKETWYMRIGGDKSNTIRQ